MNSIQMNSIQMDGQRAIVVFLNSQQVMYEGSEEDALLRAVEMEKTYGYGRYTVYIPTVMIFREQKEAEVKCTLTEQGQDYYAKKSKKRRA